MKTAHLFWTSLLVFSSAAAYSQSSANSAISGAAQGSGAGAAVSGSSSAANAVSASRQGVAGSASGAPSAAVQAGKAASTAAETSTVAAELTRKVDSKNAKVGDEVVARTTSAAHLSNAMTLPSGTRLLGKVTEVAPKSGAQPDGHLAFAFERAVLHDSREIPIHVTLQSIAAPPSAAALAAEDFGASAAPVALSGGASGRAGGGLLGGVGVPRTGLVPSATSTVAEVPGRIAATTAAADQTAAGTLSRGTALAGQTAAMVTHLPGLSASGSADGSTSLDAKGSNVQLVSGTQMMFSVAAR